MYLSKRLEGVKGESSRDFVELERGVTIWKGGPMFIAEPADEWLSKQGGESECGLQ